MKFRKSSVLLSALPIFKGPRSLYLSAFVPGATYNRRAFPRKRHFAFSLSTSKPGGSCRIGSVIPAAFAAPKPPLALGQRGCRVGFPDAAFGVMRKRNRSNREAKN